MIYLILGLVLLGVIAAIVSYYNSKKPHESGDAAKDDAPINPNLTESCCGPTSDCVLSCSVASDCNKIEYYNDEELDRFKGFESSSYDESAIDEFREVLYTMQASEVAGWLKSLQLRGINLPDSLKDEAFMLASDQTK